MNIIGSAKLKVVGLGIFVLLLLINNTIASTQIDSCTAISLPGVYILNRSIINHVDSCIGIDSNDVVLDGAGYTIDGVDSAYGGYGVSVYTPFLTNITIKNLILTDWMNGLHLRHTINGIIINNTISSNVYGIYIYESSNNNSISDNIINNNSAHGIEVYFSDHNIFTNNSVSSNSNTGINIVYSENNMISRNKISNNIMGINVMGITANGASNIISNNTVEENEDYDMMMWSCNNIIKDNIGSGGRPIKYFNYSINFKNEIISELILCNADNSNIINVTIMGSLIKKNNGFLAISTDNSSFIKINSSNNNDGFYLLSSNNNTLANNNMISNKNGVHLAHSYLNTFNFNFINSNNNGIYFETYSNHNTIINNILSQNNNGIYAPSNEHEKRNNTIYNNIFNNTNNIKLDGRFYYNAWSTTKKTGINIIGGPYIGGNLWTNPTGTGFSDLCDNVDGFCNLSYLIDNSNIDYLPLKDPNKHVTIKNPVYTITPTITQIPASSPTPILTIAIAETQPASSREKSSGFEIVLAMTSIILAIEICRKKNR